MGGAGEGAQHVANPHRVGVGQMEGFVLLSLLMGDMHHGIDHEVDRHDIDAPALNPDGRHPGRQQTAQLLDGLEEVVRAVDLVHLAGIGVTDNDARTVNPPRNCALIAHNPFRFVLGLEVRHVEVFGFIEHVLAKQTVEQASCSDGAAVVELPRPQPLGKLNSMTGPFGVDLLLDPCLGVEIIDGSQMEEVVDLADQLLLYLDRYPQQRLRHVAKNRDCARFIHIPECK